MKYIRVTRNPPLILSAKASGVLKWCIDGSFAVHNNKRGHTSGGLLMLRAFPSISSTKQKLNIRSFTETEILLVHNCIPAILCTRYWLDSQGYGFVYQDNKRAITFEQNRKESRSRCTKHMNIIYYLVTYCIEKYELSQEWFPIEDMVGDFRGETTHGAVFIRFQYKLMGVTESQHPGPRKCWTKSRYCLLFTWPLVHSFCSSHEMMILQPWIFTPPYLGSVVNFYINYSS